MHLWVLPKLRVESFPGSLVWVGDGDVVGVRQGEQGLLDQGDAALKQGQHRVPKVEPLLHRITYLKLPTAGMVCYGQNLFSVGVFWC